jgi:hypothetical protein
MAVTNQHVPAEICSKPTEPDSRHRLVPTSRRRRCEDAKKLMSFSSGKGTVRIVPMLLFFPRDTRGIPLIHNMWTRVLPSHSRTEAIRSAHVFEQCGEFDSGRVADLRSAATDKKHPVDLLSRVSLTLETEAMDYVLLLSKAACYLLCQVLQKAL